MTGGDHEIPCALKIEEIKSIVEQYSQASLNAIEADFDGVEIHVVNDFLLINLLTALVTSVLISMADLLKTVRVLHLKLLMLLLSYWC
jgi:hypothetical protein